MEQEVSFGSLSALRVGRILCGINRCRRTGKIKRQKTATDKQTRARSLYHCDLGLQRLPHAGFPDERRLKVSLKSDWRPPAA